MANKDGTKIQPVKPGTTAKTEAAPGQAETERTTRGWGANHNETTRVTRSGDGDRIAVNHNETTRTTRGWTGNHNVTIVRL
ncbi:MAG: hypothetical protein QOJ92_1551 [Frankiales bacterium]|nr:hypothetical protein [Frankiales bacterium]